MKKLIFSASDVCKGHRVLRLLLSPPFCLLSCLSLCSEDIFRSRVRTNTWLSYLSVHKSPASHKVKCTIWGIDVSIEDPVRELPRWCKHKLWAASLKKFMEAKNHLLTEGFREHLSPRISGEHRWVWNQACLGRGLDVKFTPQTHVFEPLGSSV